MTRVVIRREVLEDGETSLVSRAKLKQALRDLEWDPLSGKPLRRKLQGLRSIRLGGEKRLVYRLLKHEGEEIVEVLAIGPRRDDEVYATAGKRT